MNRKNYNYTTRIFFYSADMAYDGWIWLTHKYFNFKAASIMTNKFKPAMQYSQNIPLYPAVNVGQLLYPVAYNIYNCTLCSPSTWYNKVKKSICAQETTIFLTKEVEHPFKSKTVIYKSIKYLIHMVTKCMQVVKYFSMWWKHWLSKRRLWKFSGNLNVWALGCCGNCSLEPVKSFLGQDQMTERLKSSIWWHQTLVWLQGL